MRVLLPLAVAGLLAAPAPAKAAPHVKSVAEKKAQLSKLMAEEKQVAEKTAELKQLKQKEGELKEKEEKLEKLKKKEELVKKLKEKEAELAKVEKEEQLVKTLVEKKAELKELQAEKAQLEAVEAKKQSPKEEMKVVAQAEKAKPAAVKEVTAKEATKAVSEEEAADRLMKSLGAITALKDTFKQDEQFGGAMGNELANGNAIWGSISKLMAAAKSKKSGKDLESAMNDFSKSMNSTLHAIDTKDTIQSEEYVLGLLAHHRHNATEQRRILGNFTSLHTVQELLAESPPPADLSVEFANMLDKEHPAAKKITAFLQRLD
jgi:myosin heavy subunit